jgi:hypothetical protein
MKKFAVIALFMLFITGCGPRVVYPHLDWLIPWYINDYISLNREQKDMLQKRLLQQLDWHRHTQLSKYADLLRALGKDLKNSAQPIDYQRIKYYHASLTEHWKELVRKIGPDITDILLTASDDQIDQLFRNLEKQNQKFRAEYIDLPTEKLDKKRKKGMIKLIKHWISKLTADQQQAVSDWNSQVKPIEADLLQNSESIQAEVRRLVAHRNNDVKSRKALLEIIVNSEHMRSSAFQKKLDYNDDVTISLWIRMDRLLTAEQRSFLLKRIESLATDFDRISYAPKATIKAR